jgi:excisionase family DNA binding protein
MRKHVRKAIRRMGATNQQPVTTVPADTPGRLVSIAQFGHIIGVKKDTAYRIVADGDIPCVRIRRRRLIDRADIDKFISQRKVAV